MPSLTASCTLNGFTTAPPTRYSICRRPPAISLTRSTYSIAMSLKMSVGLQAPCIFKATVWAREMLGAASAAVAPAAVAAAPQRNLRREDAGTGCAAAVVESSVLLISVTLDLPDESGVALPATTHDDDDAHEASCPR